MVKKKNDPIQEEIDNIKLFIQSMGMSKRFRVMYRMDGTIIINDKQTGKDYYSIPEAIEAIQRANGDIRKSRGRERRVTNGKPVSLRKGKSLADVNGGSHGSYHVGLDSKESLLRQTQEQYRKDKRAVETFNRRVKEDIVSISNMNAVSGNYTFKVKGGGQYRVLQDALSEAEERLRNKKSMSHDDFYEEQSSEDLEHYGVLGMKWGIRKDPNKAYSKSMNKLSKLDSKAAKSEQKTLKYQQKSVKRQRAASSALLFKRRKARKAADSIRKANRSHLKTQRKYTKAKQWYNSMESAFKATKIRSLDPSKTALGKKYAHMKLDDMMSNAVTATNMMQLITYYERMASR